MGAMKIQIGPAMDAQEMWSGDQAIGSFAEDLGLIVLKSAE
jgi:hypothetical protein